MSTYAEARTAVRVGRLAPKAALVLGWAAAFGICSISLYVLRGLFSFVDHGVLGIVGKIPGVGGWVSSKLEKAEQKLTHWVGQAAATSEAHMADAFHASADLLQSISHEIYGQAIAYWQLAHWTYKVARAVATGEAWQEVFHNTIVSQRAQIQDILRKEKAHDRALHHADSPPVAAGVRTQTKPIAARTTWIDAHELPGIRARQRVRDRTADQEAAAERARAGGIAGTIGGLWGRLGRVEKATTGLGAVGLVTIALGRLGLGSLRCSNVLRTTKRLCGMDPNALEGLLLGTLAIVGTLSVNEFARELQGVTRVAADDLHRLIRH